MDARTLSGKFVILYFICYYRPHTKSWLSVNVRRIILIVVVHVDIEHLETYRSLRILLRRIFCNFKEGRKCSTETQM